MDAKIFGGSVWGVPASGGIVSLSGAEISSVLTAASGLAKTLFIAAGGGIVLATGLVGLYLFLDSRRKNLALNTMADINTYDSKFRGVCISDTLEIKSSGNNLSIPINYVKKIKRPIFFGNSTKVKLFDGSEYNIQGYNVSTLNFLTPVGEQKVPLGRNLVDIEGCTVAEVEKLKQSLTDFLNQKNENIVNLLGKNLFEQFFYSGK